jgi:hypothetical protein
MKILTDRQHSLSERAGDKACQRVYGQERRALLPIGSWTVRIAMATASAAFPQPARPASCGLAACSSSCDCSASSAPLGALFRGSYRSNTKARRPRAAPGYLAIARTKTTCCMREFGTRAPSLKMAPLAPSRPIRATARVQCTETTSSPTAPGNDRKPSRP